MYRTPLRRGFSPDYSPERFRNSPSSPQRGRPRRSRSRGRSPSKPHSSPPSRGRSPGRRRSRSRPATSHRSKSRPRRYPEEDYPYEKRYSPDYRPRDPRSPDRCSNRSGSGKDAGHDGVSNAYRDSRLRPPDEPLPMPKKSILKKRSDVEAGAQSPQVDGYPGIRDVGNVKPSLGDKASPVPPGEMAGKIGAASLPLTSRGRKSESPLVMGISSIFSTREVAAEKGPLHSTARTPQHNPGTSSMASIGQNRPDVSFTKEEGKRSVVDRGGFALLHQMKSETKLQSFPVGLLQEIEDEERFLYGDEAEDKPAEAVRESPKTPLPVQASTLAPPAQDPNREHNEQEYAKIHDLLKTIGLDIGVAEIGKLAVRTQERLHGKKLTPKSPQVPPKVLQAPLELPPDVSSTSPAESTVTIKTEPTVKAEKKEGPVNPHVMEKNSPADKQPGLPVKEKTLPVTQKALPKEPPVSKAEALDRPQPISTVQSCPVSLVQPISTVQTLSTVQPPLVAPVPELTPPPINPSQIPMYPPYTSTPMVPNYTIPPPSYNPYPSYVSYSTSNWPIYTPPPIHPPPPIHVPPPTVSPSPVTTPTVTHNPRSNLLVIEPNANYIEVKTSMKHESKTSPAAELLAKHEAERRNKETEKQKVLEDLEGLTKKLKANSENLRTLSAKVEQLRVQQGILLRKKRREKDGHKDPLLEELNNVLDSAHKQISSLTKEISETKQKQQQLIKVAEILGVNPVDLAEKIEPPKKHERSPESSVSSRDSRREERPRGNSKEKNDFKPSKDSSPKLSKKWDVKSKNSSKPDSDSKKEEAAQSASLPRLSTGTVKQEDDAKQNASSPKLRSDMAESSNLSSLPSSKPEEIAKSRDKSRSKSPRTSTQSSNVSPKKEEPSPLNFADIFEYYDAGAHWCEDCNVVCQNLSELLLHLHDKKHIESLRRPRRPWVKKKEPEVNIGKKKVSVPLKGAEFLVPTTGYYCGLCEQAFPDCGEAEEHVRSYLHNDKFKKYTDANSNYETVRREKQKAKSIAAEESRRQAEQKRKLAEQKNDEHSKSKRAKREQEEERSSRRRSRTSASPVSSDSKPTPTPDKEPAKNPTFGKFNWRTFENKSQASSNAPKAEAGADRDKEDETKGPSVKPKGIEIKLLGKPSNAQGSPPTASNSSPTSTSTTSLSTSTSPTTTTMKVRPNLPVPLTVLRKSSAAVSKPAPLNTFLSIKSSDATSKSLPVMIGKPPLVLPEEVVSKAFGGEEVVLKETPVKKGPVSLAATADKTSSGPSPALEKPPQPNQERRSHDLYDMLFNKKELPSSWAKGGQQKKDSPIPLIVSGVKSPAHPTMPLQGEKSDSNRFSEKSAENIQQGQQSKQATQKSGHAAFPRPEAPNKTYTPEAPKVVPDSSPKSNWQKDPNDSCNKSARKPGLLLQVKGKEAGPEKVVETRNSVKHEKAVSQASKGTRFSMNPLTGRLQYLPMQDAKPKETGNLKPAETNNAAVTHSQSVSQPEPFLTTVPKTPPKPTYNPTARLNQKFKREPLSLPTSLFGHVPDTGCKGIKITTMAAQKATSDQTKPNESQTPPAQNQVTASFTEKTSDCKPQLQQELESYYSLIATEDDPEDLVPCEDQEVDSPETITRITAPPIMDTPEKRIKLESPPAMNAPATPAADVSSEETDDSDMACEVPDVPTSNISISGLSMVQSSYGFSPTYGTTSREPTRIPRGHILVNKDYRKKEQTSTFTTQYSIEELDTLTTCDSD